MRLLSLFLFYCLLLFEAKAQIVDQLISDLKKEHSSFKKIQELFEHYRQTDSAIIVGRSGDSYQPFLKGIDYGIWYEPKKETNIPKQELYSRIAYEKDKILYIDLIRINNYPKDWDSIFQYIDTAYSIKALKKYNKKHSLSLTLNELFDFYPTGVSIYVTDTNLAKPMQIVFNAVIGKDSLKIIGFCNSFSWSLKSHGVIGLYLWSKADGALNVSSQSLLDSLINLDIKIACMWGDVGALDEKISRCLTAEFLDNIYSLFLSYRDRKFKKYIK